MKQTPILMSASMVLATLQDRKRQTRRPISPEPHPGIHSFIPLSSGVWKPAWGSAIRENLTEHNACRRSRYGVRGDRLWVKETWAAASEYDAYPPSRIPPEGRQRIWYAAGGGLKPEWVGRTRASIHLPRWASRLTLELTEDPRPERLQEITEAEAIAEGCPGENCYRRPGVAGLVTDDGLLPDEQFSQLWETLHGKGAWKLNPWVWVISFKRLEAPGC
ncbi:MAG: hypothetical protein ACK47B_10810 [Armatimonadota bacterium]